jgi:hypothetical protein
MTLSIAARAKGTKVTLGQMRLGDTRSATSRSSAT